MTTIDGIIHLSNLDFNDITPFVEAKAKLNKYSTIWKDEFSGKIHIGDCSYLYYALQPTSLWDFYLKYIDNGEQKMYLETDVRLRGRTEKELTKEALWYHHLINDPEISIEECFYCIVMHTIIETYNGHIFENAFRVEKELQGFKCDYVMGEDDSAYGIDLFVSDSQGNKLYAVQVKPLSFFSKYAKQDLLSDRVNAVKKAIKTREKYGIPTYYVVYALKDDVGEEKIMWWLHPKQDVVFENDTRFFKIDDWVNNEGYCVMNPKTVANGGSIQRYQRFFINDFK